MKVAVTGSSGLIGTALVAALRADGHEVIRLVRAAPAARTRSPGTPARTGRPGSAVAGRRGGRGAPGRGGRRRQALDAGLPSRDPRQPGAGHPGAGGRAGRDGHASGRAALRICHRLVRGHRRPGGDRVRSRRKRLPFRGGPGLGGGRRGRRPGRNPGGHAALGCRAVPQGRDPGPAAAAVPAGPRRSDRDRQPGDELDRAVGVGGGRAVPARPRRHQRPGEPDHAVPGQQRGVHLRPWPRPCTGPP